MQGTCLLAMDGHFLIAQCDMCPDSDVALLLRLTPKPEDTAGNYQKPSTCQTWEDGREYHSQTRPGDVMREDRTHTVRTLPAAHREGQAKLCCPSFQLLSFKVKASTSPPPFANLLDDLPTGSGFSRGFSEDPPVLADVESRTHRRRQLQVI